MAKAKEKNFITYERAAEILEVSHRSNAKKLIDEAGTIEVKRYSERIVLVDEAGVLELKKARGGKVRRGRPRKEATDATSNG